MEMEKIAKMESGRRNSKDGKPVSPPPYDIPTEKRYSVDETTEVKPLTKRKRKVSREIDPATQRLSGTGSLNGSLTHPWSGRLEPMEYSEPFPGPYKTALFWVRRGQGLDPIPPAFSVPASPGTVGVGSGTATEERYLAAVQGSALPQKTGPDGAPVQSPRNAPWKQGKKNTEVFMRVTFRKVGQVDTVTETFNADIIIQARWLYDENRDDVREGKQWDPMLYVENTNSNVIKPLHREMWTDPTGDVFVIQRLTARGVFTETMELDHFPFDCQNLTITVASERHSGEITLIPDPLDHSILHQGNFVDKQEWHLYEHVEVHEPEGDESDFRSSLPPRPALSFTCQAARRIGYFTWNVFLLLVVIFLMHMCSFSVAKTAYNARLSMSFTMFLTAIAFKIALNSYLPRISYLTYMDSYLLLQLVMMAFVCGWHATVSHLPTAEDVADRVERIMIIIIGILYAAFQIIFFTIAYCIPGKRRRELRDKHRDYRRGSVKMKAGSSFA